jgi:hypothetical protein
VQASPEYQVPECFSVGIESIWPVEFGRRIDAELLGPRLGADYVREGSPSSVMAPSAIRAVSSDWAWDHLLMEQDDPEKRVADLERQQAEAGGQGRRDQARHMNQASPGKAGRHLPGGIAVAILGLIWIGFGAYQSYAYHTGTPTTATDIHCTRHSRGPDRCTGTWSVSGEPYTGLIIGGGVENVRVHGDTAYTAHAGRNNFIKGNVALAFGACSIGWALWQRLASRPSGS